MINFFQSFKHYLIYFYEGWIVALKERLEFKSNFYTSLISQFGYMLFYLFFIIIFTNNFGESLNWSLLDFLLLYFFANTIRHVSGFFWYEKQLAWRRKMGQLNNILYLPGNKILNYILSRSYNSIIHLVVDFILVLPVILFFIKAYSFLSIILSFLVSLLLIYMFIVSFHFLDSFSWYFIELGKTLSSSVLGTTGEILYLYPGTFFKNSPIKFILFLIPVYFVSTIIVPIFQNNFVENLEFQLFIILVLNILFTLGIIFNWRYGLKRYEAFD